MDAKTRTVSLVVGTILVLDQVTKALVARTLGLYESVPVIDSFFHLTRVHNTGAAFGVLAQAPAWFRQPPERQAGGPWFHRMPQRGGAVGVPAEFTHPTSPKFAMCTWRPALSTPCP